MIMQLPSLWCKGSHMLIYKHLPLFLSTPDFTTENKKNICSDSVQQKSLLLGTLAVVSVFYCIWVGHRVTKGLWGSAWAAVSRAERWLQWYKGRWFETRHTYHMWKRPNKKWDVLTTIQELIFLGLSLRTLTKTCRIWPHETIWNHFFFLMNFDF